jgi:hypothetical protein
MHSKCSALRYICTVQLLLVLLLIASLHATVVVVIVFVMLCDPAAHTR